MSVIWRHCVLILCINFDQFCVSSLLSIWRNSDVTYGRHTFPKLPQRLHRRIGLCLRHQCARQLPRHTHLHRFWPWKFRLQLWLCGGIELMELFLSLLLQLRMQLMSLFLLLWWWWRWYSGCSNNSGVRRLELMSKRGARQVFIVTYYYFLFPLIQRTRQCARVITTTQSACTDISSHLFRLEESKEQAQTCEYEHARAHKRVQTETVRGEREREREREREWMNKSYYFTRVVE